MGIDYLQYADSLIDSLPAHFVGKFQIELSAFSNVMEKDRLVLLLQLSA
jgi:hypothetical protein